MVPFAILYFSWQPGAGLHPVALTWYGSVAALLFTFVLLHELGHALAAQYGGVRAKRIILFPLGGGAHLPEQPPQLGAELFVYAAGPLVNLLLAVLVLPILLNQPEGLLLLKGYLNPSTNAVLQPSLPQQLLAMTVVVNVILALGNLLPAYPLDGGRILRALLRRPVGARRATVIVTVLSVVIGLLLIGVGYQLNDWLLIVGAMFIIVMSALEYRHGWQRRRLAKRTVDSVLRPATQGDRLYPTSTVSRTQKAFAAANWPVLPVFDGWNNLRGFVDRAHLTEDAPAATELLKPYFEAEFTTAQQAENLLSVTERIVDANVYGAAVYDDWGHIVGYVFTEDVMTILRPWWRRSW